MTRFRPLSTVIAACAFLMTALPAWPCSTFAHHAAQRIIFGKNYDWMIGDGLLVVNPRGLERRGAEIYDGQLLTWTTKWGSVTFNQFGRDFPSGGINEKGLVIELMWHADALYPSADDRPALSNLQWIQYQLDTAANIDEVIASDQRVRIVPSQVRLHFLIADRQGNVATFEYLDGKQVVHRGETLPVPALTNSTYQASLAAGERAESADRSSYGRFRILRQALQAATKNAPEDPVAWAFATLKAADQGEATRWSIVYELDALKLHFRTETHPEIRSLDLATLDFSCTKPVLQVDLDAKLNGDLTKHLAPISFGLNRSLIGRSFAGVPFLKDVPPEALDQLARYPDSAACRQ